MRRPPTPDHAIVVLPTYNEAANLPVFLDRLWQALPAVRVLIVDDNSPDGTGALADGFARRYPGLVQTLHRPAKAGLGSAYRDGFRLALAQGGDPIVQMDADLSHDPAALPAMLQALRDADLVLGSRYIPSGGIENWPWRRSALSRAANWFARRMLGLPFTDLTGGLKVWRAAALGAAEIESVKARGYLFQIEATLRCARTGARIREVPIVFRDRRQGKSKLDRVVVLEAAWGIVALAVLRVYRVLFRVLPRLKRHKDLI